MPVAKKTKKSTVKKRKPIRKKSTGKGHKTSKNASRISQIRKRITLLLAILLWGILGGLGLILWYGWDLPDPANLTKAVERTPSYRVLAEDGTLLLTTGQTYGAPVEVANLPEHVPNALLALEDHRFYTHFGVDPIGIARAAYTNLKAGSTRQGASTITQQVAKTLFLTPDRTFRRKIQEALLAIWLETKFTKTQILSIYMSRVYMGNGVWGFEAAAKAYFSRPLSQLSLIQTSVLAGLPLAPSRLNPLVNPIAAKQRGLTALNKMARYGWLSEKDAKQAANQPLHLKRNSLKGHGSNLFARHALDHALDLIGKNTSDLTIRTTLSVELQQHAANGLKQASSHLNRWKASEAALLALGKDGAIKAMIGSRSLQNQAGFNRVVQAARQPGSAFKLFVYLTAIEQGYLLNQKIEDQPFDWDGWRPNNYNDKHHGILTLEEGFASSNNIVTAKLAKAVGLDQIIAMARRLGITTKLEALPALSLGAFDVTLQELVAAYGVLNRDGYVVEPYMIKTIEGADGHRLYAASPRRDIRLLPSNTVMKARQLLRTVVTQGTGRKAAPLGLVEKINWVGGKTGTSQNYRDAWFIGLSDLHTSSEEALTLGIWLGNDNNKPMNGITGGSLPACLWRYIITSHAKRISPPKGFSC